MSLPASSTLGFLHLFHRLWMCHLLSEGRWWNYHTPAVEERSKCEAKGTEDVEQSREGNTRRNVKRKTRKCVQKKWHLQKTMGRIVKSGNKDRELECWEEGRNQSPTQRRLVRSLFREGDWKLSHSLKSFGREHTWAQTCSRNRQYSKWIAYLLSIMNYFLQHATQEVGNELKPKRWIFISHPGLLTRNLISFSKCFCYFRFISFKELVLKSWAPNCGCVEVEMWAVRCVG